MVDVEAVRIMKETTEEYIKKALDILEKNTGLKVKELTFDRTIIFGLGNIKIYDKGVEIKLEW